MKTKLWFLLCCLALWTVPWAAGAQEASGYRLTTGVDSSMWQTLSSAAVHVQEIEGEDDEASSLYNIGFPFTFAGTSYTQFSCNSNGRVRLGSVCSNYWLNPFTTLTNTSYNDLPFVTAFGMDNTLEATGSYVKYELVGTAPNRILVIEYLTPSEYDSEGDLVNYQIQLLEDSNRVRFVYGATAASYYGSYQVGLAGAADDYLTVSPLTHSIQISTSAIYSVWPGVNRYYEFTPTPEDCPRVSPLDIADVTGTTATVSWAENGSSTEWLVRVNPGNMEIIAYDTTVALTGLMANTQYSVAVAALCSNGDTSRWRTGSFRTLCSSITSLPFYEDFESCVNGSSTSSTFVECWDRLNNGSSYFGYPYVGGSSYSHSGGNHGLYWYNTITTGTYGDYQYVILPPVNLDSINLPGTRLRFWAKASSTSYNPVFEVGVMTDPTQHSSFVSVGTVNVGNSTVWGEYTVNLSSYTGTGNRVAIRALRPTSSWYAYVDEIQLAYQPDCPRVQNLSLTSIGVTDALLTWTETGEATGWNVEYGPTGFARGTGTTTVVYTPSVSLTGLTASTAYTAFVSPVCSGVADEAVIGFTTLCPTLDTLPFFENFEGMATTSSTSAAFVSCWQRLNNGTTYFGYPYLSSSTSYSHNGGNRGLYWYNTTTTGTYGDYQCVVLPRFNTTTYPMNSVQLRFWAKPTSSSYNPILQVGVITNPLDINSFHQVSEVYVQTGSNTDWHEFVVSLAGYNGPDGHIAVKAVRPTSSWYIYADEFRIEQIPTCPEVTAVTIEDASAASAVFSWRIVGGINTPTGYRVDVSDADGTVVSTSTVTGMRAMVSGLDAATAYTATVTPLCGTESGAAGSVQFSTAVLPCTQMDPTTTDTIGIGNGSGTTYYLPLNNYYNYSYTQQLVLASEFGADTTVSITGIDFQYNYSSASTVKGNCTIYLANTTVSSLSSGFVPYSTAFVPVYTGSMNCSTGWNHFDFDNPFTYDGSSNLLIIVHDNSGSYDGSSFVFQTHSASNMACHVYNDNSPYNITSVSGGTTLSDRVNMKFYTGDCIEVASCVPPLVAVREVTSDQVDLAWGAGYQESSWNVEYREAGTGSWDTVLSSTTSTDYQFTDLESNTEYEFRVTALCSMGSMSSVVRARTHCVSIDTLPYVQSFEGEPTGSSSSDQFVYCMTRLNNGSTYYGYPYVSNSSTYAHTGGAGLYWYNTTTTGSYGDYQVVVMPPIDTTALPLSTVRFSFWARSSSTSYSPSFEVGVMTDPDDISTYTRVASFDVGNNTAWTLFETSFANYTGTGNYIALRANRPTVSWYAYVDDLTFSLLPDCPHVENLTVDSIMTNSAYVSWTDVSGSSYWEIEYIGSGQPADSMHSDIAYDTSFYLTGLQPNTIYNLTIRGNCSGDSIEPAYISFRTDCSYLDSLPYMQTFENEMTGSSTSRDFALCWRRLNNGSAYYGYPYISSSTTYNHTPGGSKGLYWYNTTTTGTYGDYQCLVLPQVDTDMYAINTLRLSFWAKSSSTSYSPLFYVGVMSDPNDISTFRYVDTLPVGTNTSWAKFTTYLTDIDAPGCSYVAIRANRPTSSWYAYVDDIRLEVAPTCPEPEHLEVVSSANPDSIIMTWVETGAAEEWELAIVAPGGRPDTASMLVHSYADTALFSIAQGMYDVYIHALCDYGSDTSYWVGPVTLASGFEVHNLGSHGENAMITSCHAIIYDSGGPEGTYGNNEHFTLTIYPDDDSLLSFRGWAYTESSLDYLMIYDGEDNSGQLLWRTSTSTVSENIPYVESLSGPITLVWGTDGSVLYDGFELYVNCVARPACMGFDNVTAASVGTTSAYITWNTVLDPGDSVTYEVSVDGVTTTTTTPEYFLTGLDTNTAYTVLVRTICNGTDHGEWDSVTFMTHQMPCAEYDTASSGATYTVSPVGTSSTEVMPIYTTYNYSYCNHLIRATELNAPACSFTGIDFDYAGSTPMTHTSNCSIYMCHTTMATCTDFAPVADLQLVYTGPLNCTTNGWNHFDFNVSSFAYNGSSNIIVAIVNNSGTMEGSNAVFRYSSFSDAVSHRVYRNDAPYSLADMASATASNSVWRSNMKLSTGTCVRTSSCAPPNVIARNITDNSAEIVWAPGFGESTWDVAYAPVSSSTWTTVATATSATTATITGLASNTPYIVRVTHSCDTSVYAGEVTFRTACGDLAVLPLHEDFETTPTGSSTSMNFLTCWTRLNNGTSYFGYPYVSSSSTYSHTPGTSRGLYWYNTTTSGTYGDYQYVVLPSIDTSVYPINTLQLDFWACVSSSSYVAVFQVGVMSDPNSPSTFEPVDTVTINTTSWFNAECPLSRYTGGGKYIAIRALRPTSSWYAYVDEFTVDLIPSCVRPGNLHSPGNTSNSITINWTERGEATEWQVAVETSPTNTPTPDSIVVTHPHTFNGLIGGQEYYFYVRSICGPGDTSRWSEPFTAVPGAWIMRANQTDTAYMCGGVIYDDGGPSGEYTNSQSGTTLIIYPSAPNNLVQIQGTFIGESCCDYLSIYDGAGTSSTPLFESVGSSSGIPVGPFLSTNGPLTVSFRSDASVTYNGYTLYATCVSTLCRIFNIRIDTSYALSDNALHVIWDTNGADLYQVEYGPRNFVQGTGTLLSTTTNYITISGLNAASNYDVYVRSVCDYTDTGSWSHVTLSTELCATPAIAYSYSSTASATTSTYGPIGYSFYNYSYVQTIVDSAQLAGIVDPIVAFAFNPSVTDQGDYFTNMDVYLANVPESTVPSNFIHPDSNHVFVPVITDGNFCYTTTGWQTHYFDTTFVWDGHSNLLVSVNRRHGSYSSGATFHAHSTSSAKTCYVYNDGSAYSPGTVSSGTTENYVGDIQFFSCAPGNTCASPMILSFSNDYHSATPIWNGSGTTYQINVKPSASTDWTEPDIDVTATTYTFSGLIPATNYVFRLRQDCTADSLGYSEWVYYAFTTDSLPCLVPDSLHSIAVTNATATFDWNVNGNETDWDIHVWYTGGLDSIYRVNTRPATVGGFIAGLTYNAAIRPLCGVNLVEGDWSDTVSFTTATCPDVTNFTTSNVTANSITLNWTADPMAQGWIIEYGFLGFNQGTGTTVNVTTNSYVATGLLDETDYQFYIRAVCGTDWTSENWASATATTQSGGVPCGVPTGVSATAADNSITVNWTSGTGNLSFEIEYGPSGFNHGSGIVTSAATAPATLNNLEYETPYDIYVRAICDQNTYSGWSIVATATTGQRPSEDCQPVTNLTVTDITDHTAHVAWTPAPETDSWQVVVTDPQGNDVVDQRCAEPFYDLTGLTEGTNYTVKVRTDCGDGNVSAFVSTNFRTTGGVGISDVTTASCTIFPNPTSNATTISVSGVNGRVKIEVVDMNGRVAASETLECSTDCTKTMDVDRLAQGAYFVRITADSVNMVRKLIVR